MTAYDLRHHRVQTRTRSREAIESRILFAATFPMFLAAGLLKRAASFGRDIDSRKPLIAEARAAANTCIPFTFMR